MFRASRLRRGVGQRPGHLPWEQVIASSSLASPTDPECANWQATGLWTQGWRFDSFLGSKESLYGALKNPYHLRMADAEWAWAAGLFEGEGCISIVGRRVQLSLNMTDEDVVRRLHCVVGVGAVYGPLQPRMAHYKPQWRWTVSSRADVALVLSMFWPWLGDRRKTKAREIFAMRLPTAPTTLRYPDSAQRLGLVPLRADRG